MADHNKKEKIAAAKKKLKQFQRNRSVSSTRESAEREVAPKARGRDTARAVHAGEHSAQTTPHTDSSATDISTSNDVSIDSIHGSPATPPHTHIEAQHQYLPPSSNGDDRLRGTLSSHGERPSATTESLHQLSRQVNGLLSEPSAAYLNGTESASQGMQDLEDRNRELASSLAQHQQVNEQLNVQNHQLREHSQALQIQLETERNSFHDKQKKDIGSLKEQLQVHIQTIGILVAEKTELQSQVSQSQRIGNQRIEEIEELSGRLKASRQRVSDLERSVSSSSQSSQQLEKSATVNAKELDRLTLEAYKSNKQNEELKQQISELSEQLQSKSKEWISSSAEVTELHKKLEMAELYAQQMSNENSTTVGSVEVLTSLQKERDSLVSRLHQQEELSLKLQIERDQVTEQYQQYTEQLRHQASQLTQQVTVLTEEREQLLNKQHDLEGGMHELQTKLEDAENTPHPPPAPSPSAPTTSETPSLPPELVAELEKLRIDVVEAGMALETRARDNVQLGRLLEEKEERIMNLERSVEDMGEANGDKVQLLESIQSDRTALSRALTQNKDLKSQLEELQQGFVKISTDNAELLTKLQTEQHSSYEWKVKLVQKEDEMNALREMLSARESEVSTLQESHQSIEKEVHQHSQMRDRLQHYEAQAQLVYTLQNELTAAQDMMEALTTQNSELRTMLIKATEVKGLKGSGDSSEGGGNSGHDDVVASLQASIQQLENERTQLYESLKEQRKLSDTLGIKIADLQEEVIRRTEDANPDSERISRTEYVELRTAMEMIQQKYMHVMHDKAELTDKADQLEHLVLQLQGETDTIGEYISLYHHQRALLLQRETQKNDYIAQLARDREQLQDKLGELQALVMQLLGERNMLHSYSQESSMPPEVLGPSTAHSQAAQLANGINHYDNDWPDYTSSDSDSESETEPIVGGQLTPDSEVTPQSSPPGSPREPMPNRLEQLGSGDHHSLENGHDEVLEKKHHHHNHHHNNHHHHHPHSQQQSESFPSAPAAPENDRTAHKILSLLTELGHSHMVEQVPLIDRNFLPCKYCKGQVQIV